MERKRAQAYTHASNHGSELHIFGSGPVERFFFLLLYWHYCFVQACLHTKSLGQVASGNPNRDLEYFHQTIACILAAYYNTFLNPSLPVALCDWPHLWL